MCGRAIILNSFIFFSFNLIWAKKYVSIDRFWFIWEICENKIKNCFRWILFLCAGERSVHKVWNAILNQKKKKQKLATASKVDLNLFFFVSFIQNRIIWHPLCVSQCIVLSVHNGFVANMSEGDVDVERFIETKQPRKVSIKWNWSWSIGRKLLRRIYILIESRCIDVSSGRVHHAWGEWKKMGREMYASRFRTAYPSRMNASPKTAIKRTI